MNLDQVQATGINHWQKLPLDVQRIIFGQLPGPALGTAQKVCRAWYMIGQNEQMWQNNLKAELAVEKDPKSIIPAKKTYGELFSQAMKARKPYVPEMPAIPASALPAPQSAPQFPAYAHPLPGARLDFQRRQAFHSPLPPLTYIHPQAANLQQQALPKKSWIEKHGDENKAWFDRTGPYANLSAKDADRLHLERGKAIDKAHGSGSKRMDKIALENHNWFHKTGPYAGLSDKKADKLHKERMKKIEK